MAELDEIKHILLRMTQFIEQLADETAELVDQFHRVRVEQEVQHTIAQRASALVSGAQELRRDAERVLDKTDRQATSHNLS